MYATVVCDAPYTSQCDARSKSQRRAGCDNDTDAAGTGYCECRIAERAQGDPGITGYKNLSDSSRGEVGDQCRRSANNDRVVNGWSRSVWCPLSLINPGAAGSATPHVLL